MYDTGTPESWGNCCSVMVIYVGTSDKGHSDKGHSEICLRLYNNSNNKMTELRTISTFHGTPYCNDCDSSVQGHDIGP